MMRVMARGETLPGVSGAYTTRNKVLENEYSCI